MPNYQAGQPLTDISAAGLNRAMMAGDWFARHKQIAENLPFAALTRETDIIKIENHTGDDLEKGHVAEVHPYLTPLGETTNRHLWFRGEEVTEDRGFGIARNPIPNGEIGELQVSGVCKARINFSTEHRWARPKQGQRVLESGHFGPCYILHRPTSGGEDVEATVVIAQPHMVLMATCELAEDMCAIENAVLDPETFTPIKNGPFLLTPDPIPEEALNLFGREAQDGDLVLLFYDGEEDSWFVAVVTPHSFTFGGLVEVDTVGMVITQETLEGVVETCMQSQTQTIADLTECPEEGS